MEHQFYDKQEDREGMASTCSYQLEGLELKKAKKNPLFHFLKVVGKITLVDTNDA